MPESAKSYSVRLRRLDALAAQTQELKASPRDVLRQVKKLRPYQEIVEEYFSSPIPPAVTVVNARVREYLEVDRLLILDELGDFFGKYPLAASLKVRGMFFVRLRQLLDRIDERLLAERQFLSGSLETTVS